MLYAVKVNFAIAELGLNPNDLKGEFRRLAQSFGKANGYSPQEAALFICSEVPLSFQTALNPAVARKWARERRINTSDPNLMVALVKLGWDYIVSS